jgi:Ni/Co efflux regulator RcnB
MHDALRTTLMLALSAALGGAAIAQPGHGGSHPSPHAAAPRGEPHEGPRGYQRVTEPHGWNARPSAVDRGAYQHNFQAARSFRIGPYHRPPGWTAHRWGYGEILPRAYWGPRYVIGDYWLFALEVPPGGYEWVRDGSDALLVDTNTGEILQVEYGVFA